MKLTKNSKHIIILAAIFSCSVFVLLFAITITLGSTTTKSSSSTGKFEQKDAWNWTWKSPTELSKESKT